MNADDAPVFASWFTGLLRIPQGKLLKYVHGGFGSLQERDLIISIESSRQDEILKELRNTSGPVTGEPDAATIRRVIYHLQQKSRL